MAAYTVVYDSCVLYPAPLRDLLLRIALKGVVRARWSERILDEVFESLRRHRPDLSAEKLARTRGLMNESVRGCLVSNFEPLVEGLTLPDPNDRHVLAAAIRCGAQAIVLPREGERRVRGQPHAAPDLTRPSAPGTRQEA